MKLETLASEPKLIMLSIDDPVIVERYGETIEFYIYDRQDLDLYMRLSTLQGDTNLSNLAAVVRDMIFNEAGEPILGPKQTLPLDIMLKVIEETIKHLGNSATQTLATSAQNSTAG